MRIFPCVTVENASIVELVDTHLPRGMDNLARSANHAHMHDAAFFILEECQVANLTFRSEIQWLPQLNLLRGVSWNLNTYTLVYQLGKTRAVDTRGSPSTPKIGGTKKSGSK